MFFCVICQNIGTIQEKLAPAGWHGWHVFATLTRGFSTDCIEGCIEKCLSCKVTTPPSPPPPPQKYSLLRKRKIVSLFRFATSVNYSAVDIIASMVQKSAVRQVYAVENQEKFSQGIDP